MKKMKAPTIPVMSGNRSLASRAEGCDLCAGNGFFLDGRAGPGPAYLFLGQTLGGSGIFFYNIFVGFFWILMITSFQLKKFK